MTRDELLEQLNQIVMNNGCPDDNHKEADLLLLRYINDHEITMAFTEIEKWYA